MSKLDHEMTREEWKKELEMRIYLDSEGGWDGWYKKLENNLVEMSIDDFYTFVIQESAILTIVSMLNDMHEGR